ncbi:hypothetical protein KC992_03170 [Candidatus Saccharibacteria bacterium]|nr:hypothetical protein [Candidatus Saccharibacteria bacterium]
MEHHEHTGSEKMKAYSPLEYVKFAGVMLFIVVFAAIDAAWPAFDTRAYLNSFMGVFFIVFAGFKLVKLQEFAYGFQSYDLVAKRSLAYSYAYPFIQLLFGALYLFNQESPALHLAVLVVSLVSGAGVAKSILQKNKVHCVCLGGVIKLPLSTITLIEDFGMAAMAVYMLLS